MTHYADLGLNEPVEFIPDDSWKGRHGMILDFPYLQLNNDLVILNFSSFHTYKFHTGEELKACTKDVADKYKLDSSHLESIKDGWTDISIHYSITPVIFDALDKLHSDYRQCNRDLDIILVPFLLMDTLRWNSNWGNWNKVRTCKKVDPRDMSQGIFSDKFCI